METQERKGFRMQVFFLIYALYLRSESEIMKMRGRKKQEKKWKKRKKRRKIRTGIGRNDSPEGLDGLRRVSGRVVYVVTQSTQSTQSVHTTQSVHSTQYVHSTFSACHVWLA